MTELTQEQQPEMDDDGYPTEETLETISSWKIRSRQDCQELLEYCQLAWAYKSYFRSPNDDSNKWHVSTGGWSGNESIIEAMEENLIFWAFCWEQSRRGGHYIFDNRMPDLTETEME